MTSGVIADTPTGRFLIDTGDETVGGRLFVTGTRGELSTLQRLFGLFDELGLRGSGDTLLDVGANIGTTTIPALLSGRFAHAVAIEAMPNNQRLLRANLCLNDLEDRVDVVAAAAGAEAGRLQLFAHPRNSGAHEVAYSSNRPPFGEPGVNPVETIEVEAVTLDGLVASGRLDLTRIALTWIDTQGYEGQVLAGANQLGAAGAPVCFEFWPPALEESGGLDLLAAWLPEHYDSLLDIRSLSEGAPAIRSAHELEAMASELSMRQRTITDLLAFRRPAPAATVP